MKDLLKKLVEAWGPCGFEHQVRDLIKAEVQGLADEIRVDALGNLICRMGSGGTRVMVAAHMDEIGVMVAHVDRQGFLRFSALGVPFPLYMPGTRVKFENGAIGVIGWEGSNRSHAPAMDKMFIDVSGLNGNKPGIGDPAIFWRTFDEQGDQWIAKSMDDRIGCLVAIETMRKLKNSPHEVYFVFTVQEEVGVRGATTSAVGVKPDVGIALDVTGTGDTPKSMHQMAVDLGGGAAIKVMDVKHITPPALKNLLIETARENNIPYQLEILQAGSTDASAIQLAHEGVPSGTISIPCRYVHSPSEMVHKGDVQACIDLLAGVLTKPLDAVRPQ